MTKIAELTVSKRVSVAAYETSEVTVRVIFENNENPHEVFNKANAYLNEQIAKLIEEEKKIRRNPKGTRI